MLRFNKIHLKNEYSFGLKNSAGISQVHMNTWCNINVPQIRSVLYLHMRFAPTAATCFSWPDDGIDYFLSLSNNRSEIINIYDIIRKFILPKI